MARLSLNQSIFRLIVGIVLITAAAILVNVWMAMTDHATKRLERDLRVAQNVLEQVLDNRERQLFSSAEVLAADFGFKQAVATREAATINSVLQNHGERISADVMALVSLQGASISSTPATALPAGVFPFPELIDTVIQDGGAVTMMMLNQRLYQVVMLTVDAPTPIAIALIGFEVDQDLVRHLKELTQLHTTISVIEKGTKQYAISTLPPAAKTSFMPAQQRMWWWLQQITLGDNQFISRQFQLDGGASQQVLITLSENVHTLFSEFGRLLANISLIALASSAFALLFASLFSKKIALPLTRLAGFARQISEGDYDRSIDTSSNSVEFDYLATALASMRDNIRDREQKITWQAQHDDLTKLYDRHHLGELIGDKLASGQRFQVVVINIFEFRGINDVFGHQNGDACLQVLAARLAGQQGISARLTGGEMVWIPQAEISLQGIEAVIELLQQPVDTGEVVIEPKLVVGNLDCPAHASSAEELFRRISIVIDEAAVSRTYLLNYEAAMEERYLRRLSIITELKKTLTSAQQELSLVYQPKLDLRSGKITAAEALIRWTNSSLGFVPPDDFIAVAEGAGLIEQITQWVLERVVEDVLLFREAGADLNVAVNLSAKDLVNRHLAESITSRLAAAGLDCDALSFEITEGDMVKDSEAAIAHLQIFRDSGFRLAIDDFGTGYSSMAYLQQFPVDTIKIDKAFVLNLDSQTGDQRIVKTVLELARGFNMTVVAEGVENAGSLAMLKAWGCEYAQGYFICKPTPPEQLIAWLRENQHTNWLEQV